MKILKILGIVAGLHAFALLLIFANPGCSSASQPATAKDNPPAKPAAAPIVADPDPALMPAPTAGSAISYGSDTAGTPTIRYSPTRPGTPVASALETQPVADVTPATTYTVVRGDSLWTVARKNHITVGDLASANRLKAGSALHIGQKLILPAKSGARTASVLTASTGSTDSSLASAAALPDRRPADTRGIRGSPDSVRHIVKPGETLGAIARHYKVKVGDIATANNISDPRRIHPGQELIIPGQKAAGVAESPAPTDKNALAIPGQGQDADAGGKPASAGEVPVIQVDDGSAAASAKP